MLCWVVNYCKLQQSRAVTATNPSIRVIFRHIHPHERDYKRALKPSPLRTAIQRFSTSYSIIMHLRLSSLVVDRPLIAPLLPFSSLGLDFRLEPLFTGPPLSLENQSTFFFLSFSNGARLYNNGAAQKERINDIAHRRGVGDRSMSKNSLFERMWRK